MRHDHFAQRLIGTVYRSGSALQQRAPGNRIPTIEEKFLAEIHSEKTVRDGNDPRAGLQPLHHAGLVEAAVMQIGVLRSIDHKRVGRTSQFEDFARHGGSRGVRPTVVGSILVIGILRSVQVAVGSPIGVVGGRSRCAARPDILTVFLQDMEVAVHPRGRVVIRLAKIKEMLYDAPAIDKAQPRPLDRNEPLVGLIHRKRFVATVDLAHGAGRCIEEINRLLRSVLQQQQVETTNHLADRKRQRGNLDAVVAFGRRFRRE